MHNMNTYFVSVKYLYLVLSLRGAVFRLSGTSYLLGIYCNCAIAVMPKEQNNFYLFTTSSITVWWRSRNILEIKPYISSISPIILKTDQAVVINYYNY